MPRTHVSIALGVLTMLCAIGAGGWMNESLGASSDDAAVEKKLSEPIQVDLQANPLEAVLMFIKTRSGVNINVDWQALGAKGLQRDTPITLNLNDTPVSAVLDAVLYTAVYPSAGYSIADGAVVIPQEQGITSQTYDLRPVAQRVYATARPDAEQVLLIANAIRDNVTYGDWQAQGGKIASAQIESTKLTVRHHRAGHEQVADLIKQLSTRAQPRAGSPAYMKTRIKLRQKMNADFQKYNLENVIEYIRQIGGLDIVMDWKQLEQNGIKRDMPITLSLTEVPIKELLDGMLQANDPKNVMGYTVTDTGYLLFTTHQRLNRMTVPRVYDVGSLVGATRRDNRPSPQQIEKNTEALMKQLRDFIAPEQWRARKGPSSMRPLETCIIVDTTLDNHEQLADMLTQMRRVPMR